MGGTLLNIITVAIGGTLGLLIGNRLNERIQQSIVMALGLVTLVVGLSNAQSSRNILIPLLSVVLGVIIGELLRLDVALERFAAWLQARLASKGSDNNASQRERFVTGFVTASLLFCVGPLTFVGSVQDGMGLAVGFQALAIKSVLDGFAAMAFAAVYGVGVLATILTIIVVQGGLALVGMGLAGAIGAGNTEAIRTAPAVIELTATGGILLMGLSLSLLDIKKPRIANFLPALLIAPLIVIVGTALGINLFP